VVTVSLTAPASAQAGSSITYAVLAANIGAANAPQVILSVTMPDGSVQTPTVGSLAPNGSFSTTLNYAIPSTQPVGNITATASVIWNDALQGAYGPLNATATTAVTNPVTFQFTDAQSGSRRPECGGAPARPLPPR